MVQSSATIRNSQITKATKEFVESVTSSLAIQNCTFRELTLGVSNFVYSEEESTVTITDSTFDDVTGTANIISLQDTTSDITNVSFIGTASIRGIQGSFSVINITRSVFKSLQSDERGGAILLNSCNGTIEDSTFEENMATTGGAIFYSCL